MANVDSPFGLRPIRHRNGAPYNGAVNHYYVPATDATDLFIGDPVVVTGTANTALVKGITGGNWDVGTLPEVAKATAGGTNRITGAVVGFMPTTNDSPVYGAASTERVVMVADDPDLLFEIQGDEALAVTGISANANLVFTHAGDTITGQSGAELDTSSAAVTATLQLRILRLVPRVDNEINSAFQKLEVMINLHTNAVGVGSLGV